jgi:hemoglobin
MINEKDIQSRKDIELLVHSFYDKVRRDEVIGYIFNDVAKVNWEHHIPIICDFWENILFQTNSYRGNPMTTHVKLNHLSPLTSSHFERWLKLFAETVNDHFKGENAELAKQRAISIATMMRLKIIKPSGTGLNRLN